MAGTARQGGEIARRAAAAAPYPALCGIRARVAPNIWYDAARFCGGAWVGISVDRLDRVALAVALVAALGLAACGRKGPLDAPPAAGLTDPQAPTPRPSLGEESDSLLPPLPNTDAKPQRTGTAPAAAQQPPKTFFLDFLIGK